MRTLVILGLVAAARAEAAPDEASPELVPISVTSRLDGTTAMFAARYVFHDVEAGPQARYAELELPESGVVTSASVVIGGIRHVLALGHTAELDDGFQRLASGEAHGEPGRAVIVRGHESGAVTIDVALPVTANVELDLAIAAPTCLFGDSRFASIPEAWKIGVPRNADISSACNDRFSNGARWARFATTELDGAPDNVAMLGGRLVAGSTHVARVEVDLPRSLAATPPDLATAIVIDASRSMMPAQLDAQRETVLAYLRLVPRSRVQVFATARTATAMLPGWMPAESVLPRLERELRQLTLQNGSNIDAGIAAAERALAQVSGTHRIIVIGDGAIPTRIADALPAPHELTHVVTVDGNATGLLRDPEIGWSQMSVATTGIALRGGPKEIDATILVRPIALDSMTIASTGWKRLDSSTCGDTLDAGHSCTWWSTGTAVSSPIVVEGLLWNRKVTRIVQLDPRRATAIARELSASRLLDDTAQAAVDAAAHAVNDSWSLGVFWGGSAGYDTLLGGGGSFTTSSIDGTRGTFIGPPSIGTVIVQTDLRPQFRPAVERCHGAGHKVAIDLETTHKEIVDVAVTVTPADDAIRSCIVEAVWNIELDPHDQLDHVSRHVAL